MKIFVGNLSFQITESELEATFAQHGVVTDVKLIRDHDTGQLRGFGFVEMSNSTEAMNAINALNGRELHGRAINVTEARPRPERGAGSRYGQRSDRGGSRW